MVGLVGLVPAAGRKWRLEVRGERLKAEESSRQKRKRGHLWLLHRRNTCSRLRDVPPLAKG